MHAWWREASQLWRATMHDAWVVASIVGHLRLAIVRVKPANVHVSSQLMHACVRGSRPAGHTDATAGTRVVHVACPAACMHWAGS